MTHTEEKDSIITYNRDVEPYVTGATGITFVHFSDIHAMPLLWDRIVQYIDHYADHIAFALHTGDYCGGSQKVYTDMYLRQRCRRTIYNCVGNHDCFSGEGAWLLNQKEVAHRLLFNHTEDWGATFFDCPCSMSYYRDFDTLRLIILDDYYDIWLTRAWLRTVLREAAEAGLHVITAQHEPTHYVHNTYHASFHTLDDYNTKFRRIERERTAYDFDHRCRVLYEDILEEFIAYGGHYVCNLAGHDHVDQFGLTDKGVLNVVIQNSTSWALLGDTERRPGERSEDCFNVVSVDTKKSTLTLVRIGANTDRHGRVKHAMTFDYQNKVILSEC